MNPFPNSSGGIGALGDGLLVDTAFEHHPFFDGMPVMHRQRLRAMARVKDIPAHTVIFQSEAEADDFHLLLKGTVVLETPYLPGRGTIAIDTLEVGSVLGCSWIFKAPGRRYSAVAASDVTTVCFEIRTLQQAIIADHDLGFEMAMRIGRPLLQRLNRTREELQKSCECKY